MTEFSIEEEMRLHQLPRVDLVDWTGIAILIEARTGVAYSFSVDVDEPDILVEGFFLPVSTEARPARTLEECTYIHGWDHLHPERDESRPSNIPNCMAVKTAFGDGWLVSRSGSEVPQGMLDQIFTNAADYKRDLKPDDSEN